MPRLTRTQKFADLREQLANDAERNLSTPQLDEYANRLNQMEGQAGYFNQAQGYNQYPQQPQYSQQYQQPQFNNQFVNPQQPQYQQPVQPQYVEQPQYQQPVQPTYQQPTYVAPTPVVDPTPVYVAPEPVVQPVQPTYVAPKPVTEPQPYVDPFTQRAQETPVVQPVQPTYVAPEPVVEPTPVFVKPEPVQQAPVVEPTPVVTPTFEEFMKTTEIPTPVVEDQSGLTQQEINAILEPFNDQTIPTIAEIEKREPVLEDIPSQEAELLDDLDILHMDEPKQDVPVANDTFVEVNTYNQGVGNDTIDQITNDLVDNIRHPEEAQEPVYEEVEVSDEEFSNTVSMEISKVMEEVAAATTQLDVKDILAPTEAEKTPNDFVKEYFNNGEDQLSKTLNDLPKVEEITPQQQLTSELQRLATGDTKEDIVEIKNIADLEGTHDVISDTIPFAINQDEEEDEYYDEDEDDASNTVLNVILIVLIIILVAVLGLIVFYILKTKGILG